MSLTDVIAARRKFIEDSAPCVGCGDTLANCLSHRGEDPTAPPWFGCCARGTAMAPCHHVPNHGALLELLAEIEAGTVRTVEEATPKPKLRRPTGVAGMSWLEYFDQNQVWKPQGRPALPIADMDPEWRLNTVRFLERNAPAYAIRYTGAEHDRFYAACLSPIGPSETAATIMQRDLLHNTTERARDPLAWIRTTPLYRALAADLPSQPKALHRLAMRAQHWSTCPGRTNSRTDDCRCDEIRAQHEHEREIAVGCPEWTDD